MLKKLLEIFRGSKSTRNKSNEHQKIIPYSNNKLNNAHIEFLKYINKKIILKYQTIGANI